MTEALLADASAVTAWSVPGPVSKTGVQSQAAAVQEVFQPFLDTQTNSPPISQVVAACGSWIIGVTNRAFGSQSARNGFPLTVAWPAQVGLTKELKVCPPSWVA